MLRRRGIASTLYLGAAKGDDASEPVAAHAWLHCATQIITGATGHERFTIIATFGDDEARTADRCATERKGNYL